MVDFLKALAKHAIGKIGKEEKRRAEICLNCPEKIEKYEGFFNSKIVEINGLACGICKCPLATKIFAREKNNTCPKWL